MAMLAEPRRKQKWSVDPRNSAWSKDESKFGQKMLERMGWSKGKGLGKSEQGGTEHIKVKVKNNNLGLGTSANHEDNWIAHQDDFNQLLADLNNCHGQSTTAAPQEQSFSLEEKSKTSKKRVHYMKFTKGKDLSSRSQTDLACIFGTRTTRPGNPPEEESSSQESQEEKDGGEVEVVTPDPEVEASINTVTSSLTMQEYFAQRMSQRRGRVTPKTPPTDPAPETPPTDPAPVTPPIDPAPDSPPAPKAKSKKKKKVAKERGAKEEQEERAGDMEGSVSHEAEQESCGVRNKKKKKKRMCAEAGEQREEGGVSCGGRGGGVQDPPLEQDPSLEQDPPLDGQPDLGHTGKRKRSEEEQRKPKKDKKKRKGE